MNFKGFNLLLTIGRYAGNAFMKSTEVAMTQSCMTAAKCSLSAEALPDWLLVKLVDFALS